MNYKSVLMTCNVNLNETVKMIDGFRYQKPYLTISYGKTCDFYKYVYQDVYQ